MKWLAVMGGALGLAGLLSGCEAPAVYGGAYGGVYEEYPTTYYGTYSTYPVYPYHYRDYDYPYHHGPYARDHYWHERREHRHFEHDRD